MIVHLIHPIITSHDLKREQERPWEILKVAARNNPFLDVIRDIVLVRRCVSVVPQRDHTVADHSPPQRPFIVHLRRQHTPFDSIQGGATVSGIAPCIGVLFH